MDWQEKIQPVLSASCVPCHHGEKAAGGLQLDSAQGIRRAVTPRDPGGSPLYRRITAQDEATRMPPRGMPPLAPEKIALIRTWIEQGAPGLPANATVDYARDVQPIFAA